MSYNLLCLWFWIRFIAVPFFISRFPELVKRRIQILFALQRSCLAPNTTKVANGLKNLSSKSEVELEPLFAQVGECRQLFSERFGKDSKPYTSSVSQDIHSTHSHLDCSSMLASPMRVGDLAHTQQFCDYLSLFFKKVSRVAVVNMFCRTCIFVAWKVRSGVTPSVIARLEEDANTLGRDASWRFPKEW